ncbi:helix-turn-helix domain-containing protein [Bacillus sp. PS06]|uniref:helix-turn-helix domain-containing protein n=1 Tax=Bacillus sp. PS06 TaxID=2764176 RepID=UPI0017834F24|nr:helix-turn-helix transcriptional regulator [Bacillus sp. PS06]MBD8069768.1 helix-turn-helix transcriptional regulator [Bacillus sp. PS06]
MPIDYENLDISRLVKTEREQRSLDLEEVGSGVGTSANYIFRIEKGRVKPPIHVIEKIIKYFDLDDKKLELYRSLTKQSKDEVDGKEEREEATKPTDAINVVDIEVLRKKKSDKKSMD